MQHRDAHRDAQTACGTQGLQCRDSAAHQCGELSYSHYQFNPPAQIPSPAYYPVESLVHSCPQLAVYPSYSFILILIPQSSCSSSYSLSWLASCSSFSCSFLFLISQSFFSSFSFLVSCWFSIHSCTHPSACLHPPSLSGSNFCLSPSSSSSCAFLFLISQFFGSSYTSSFADPPRAVHSCTQTGAQLQARLHPGRTLWPGRVHCPTCAAGRGTCSAGGKYCASCHQLLNYFAAFLPSYASRAAT